MNNYMNFPNKYYQPNLTQNFVNNDLTMGNTKKNLYNPYEGFIRGNIYKELYDPYKQQKPFQIQPMNEQAETLTSLDSLGFAMIDLDLYLDVYPNDRNAIELFNQYRNQKEEILKQYEAKYGPLLLNSNALNTYPWAWNNKPWPWEN